MLEEFEGRMNAEVRRQEKLNMAEEKDFRRGELPRKFMVKILYRWNDGKFEEEYLRKLVRNWWRWKSVSLEKKPWRGDNVKNKESGLDIFLFLFLIYFLYSIFRTMVRVRVTRSHCHTADHIRWHRSQVIWYREGYRRFWKDDVIQYVIHMLTLRYIHGHLG